jgi:hypothetical protein
MKTIQPEYVRCPKCGGKVFFDRDHYGWYAQCLLCGLLRNLEEVPLTSSQVKHWVEAEKEEIRG